MDEKTFFRNNARKLGGYFCFGDKITWGKVNFGKALDVSHISSRKQYYTWMLSHASSFHPLLHPTILLTIFKLCDITDLDIFYRLFLKRLFRYQTKKRLIFVQGQWKMSDALNNGGGQA